MMETPDKGVAMDFLSVSDGSGSYSWPPTLPSRLRKRLLADCNGKSPSTVEEIEAKLRHASLRRKQFYEKLSSKARPKQRSPSRSSSNEEDLSQRLEAKLQAAELKRLDILTKAQLRLAKIDELRQAAKLSVQSRLEKEREKLGTKVELRIQQAEANRLLLLKACRNRRATLKERASQSLLRRMNKEYKYKECVRAAINQKRAAAEVKRLRLLEEEKQRAHARSVQVQHVSSSVSHQREIERKRIQDQLEVRLQRAKRQRAEYLRQRIRQRNSIRARNRMLKQADLLSRKLARCWKRFLQTKRTTYDLAKSYDTLNLTEESVRAMPFEQLAVSIESISTLQTVRALLERLESRLRVSKAVAALSHPSAVKNIDHLLNRVATPKKRANSRSSTRKKEAKIVGNNKQRIQAAVAKPPRYPVRVVLCAYMILGHPDAVFSGQGERETALAASAKDFVQEFELLIRIILDGPIQSSDEETESTTAKRWTFRSQLEAFDRCWCEYLNCFVVWKVRDAKLLEEDLVRAACQLELSMMQTCKLTAEGDDGALTHDMKAVQKQVNEDQKLLREKVLHLGGVAGIERMECALSNMRSKYFQAKEAGNPVESPVTNTSASSSSSSSPSLLGATSVERRNPSEDSERPSRVVRSLFREDITPLPNEFGSFTSDVDNHRDTSAVKLASENEVIVNTFLHDRGASFSNGFVTANEDESNVKGKIREMMEKAFWNSIIESVEGEEAQYDRVVQLMREVRDEICDVAPQSWKQEISEVIDVDILSQVLQSGDLDILYLAKLLDFALSTLRKLSSPASDTEMKARHEQLLKELTGICEAGGLSKQAHVVAMVKGLRFVFEQIQELKQEISKARIKLMEPLLKGPAGFDYLRTAFGNRFGAPYNATASLPLTVEWLTSLKSGVEREWNEHTASVSSLLGHENESQSCLPSATLRTGGSFLMDSRGTTTTASSMDGGNGLQECRGERVDLLVRIGLLKLVCRVSGLTHDTLPETLMLNLTRLRAVQAQIQKIIVISTSILICRQTLLMERAVSSSADMESVLSNCIQKLAELIDSSREDAGIDGLVDVLSDFPSTTGKAADAVHRESRKSVMARMLAKSLQAGDPVFERVSNAAYMALRAVVLGGGGNGSCSRKLAEAALRPIGAAVMLERVVDAGEALGIVAAVSVRVHEQWYVNIIDGGQAEL